MRSDESRCPHCDATLRDERGVVARSRTAILMGLALAACGGDDNTTSTSLEPEYGVPQTESATVSETQTTTDATGSTSDATDVGEPEYGVPDTGIDETSGTETSGTDTGGTDTGATSIEPDYGTAETL